MDNTEEIKYMPKPDWVSWADIKECTVKAHSQNAKKGFVMQNQTMSVEEFAEYYKNAHCFVAMKDDVVIGTSSFIVRKLNKWYAKGYVIYNCGDAIIPEYRGTDVYTDLLALRAKYIEKTGIRVMMFDTAEENKLVQKITMKKGAKKVQLYASPKTWYYSVVMVKWMDGCPYSDWYCNFRFKLSKFIVKLLWKPGRKWRFLLSKNNTNIYENR